jgi:hypothetical protein
LGPIVGCCLTFERTQFARDEGGRSTSSPSQPSLGRRAVLMITEDVLECRRGLGE